MGGSDGAGDTVAWPEWADVPVQPAAEQEPLLEGQEAGNSVNATKEDVESGGHGPDSEVRAGSE